MKDEAMDEQVFEQRVREAAAAATMLPVPDDAWERIAARVREDAVVLLPTQPLRRGMTISATRGLRVAGLVLVACGAAAATMVPASPVRQWLEDVFTPRGTADAPAPAGNGFEAEANAAPLQVETTLVLEPWNGAIVVALEEPREEVSLLVRFVEAGEPEVRATGAAAGAQFRSGVGRLTVANATGGGLVLTVPRTTARVRVEVDGRAYLVKENGRIHVLAPAADTAGSEILLQIRR